MSGLIAELLPPENGDSLLCACCQNCQRRETCPYACCQTLRRGARQGLEMARELTAQAERLEAVIARSDGVCQLLKGDWDLLCALKRALDRELALIHGLGRSEEGGEARERPVPKPPD